MKGFFLVIFLAPIDGVELEGLEWAPTKDKEGNTTDYTWKGFNKDDDGNWVAPEGTVSGGTLGNYTLSSDASTGTGTIERHSSLGSMSSGVVASTLNMSLARRVMNSPTI